MSELAEEEVNLENYQKKKKYPSKRAHVRKIEVVRLLLEEPFSREESEIAIEECGEGRGEEPLERGAAKQEWEEGGNKKPEGEESDIGHFGMVWGGGCVARHIVPGGENKARVPVERADSFSGPEHPELLGHEGKGWEYER